jgi:DNA-binding NarL/FixJ family response regulator
MGVVLKILIVDDHKIFCDGLRLILTRLEPRPEVLEAASGQSALTLAEANSDLDLLMLDINLPDEDGVDVLLRLAKKFPSLPIIMLTATENRNLVRRCFEAGASGYIPKTASAEIMLNAIRLVMSGGIYVPPSMIMSGPANGAAVNDSSNGGRGLTERQKQVLEQLKQGITNRQIAERLGVSEATVKVHISAILKTLGLRSRVEAALLAQRQDQKSG